MRRSKKPGYGSSEPAPSATSPSRLPSPTASGWKTFTTSDRDLTFDYPGDWTVEDPAGTSPLGGMFVGVLNAAGKPMAVLQTKVVTGLEARFGAVYDPANNTTPVDPALPYLEKAELYVDTGEYRSIRRMITSLRPAG